MPICISVFTTCFGAIKHHGWTHSLGEKKKKGVHVEHFTGVYVTNIKITFSNLIPLTKLGLLANGTS